VLRASLRRGVWHVLLHWSGMPAADATWEPVEDFRISHPDFQLEDELFVEGGRCYGRPSLSEEERWRLGAWAQQPADPLQQAKFVSPD
jgi:hypothetical protein